MEAAKIESWFMRVETSAFVSKFRSKVSLNFIVILIPGAMDNIFHIFGKCFHSGFCYQQDNNFFMTVD